MSKKPALGRGLSSLFPIGYELDNDNENNKELLLIDINDIIPNPYQPRKTFDQNAIQELSESIKEHGVITPIIVKKSIRGYYVIAGERRWRASKLAGLSEIPAFVRDFTDEQMQEIALIENLQREDLNPIEIAEAYDKLITKLNYTQEQLAKRVGKSRSQVANFLRLINLPTEIKDNVSRGTISYGHARALLGITDKAKQKEIAEKIVKGNITVRDTEAIAHGLTNVSRETKKKKDLKTRKIIKSPEIKALEKQMQEILATNVQINHMADKGRIEIDYFSIDDLERIANIINHD